MARTMLADEQRMDGGVDYGMTERAMGSGMRNHLPFALSEAAQRRSRRAVATGRAMFSLYILECADGTLYVGHTDNLDERMRQHEAGVADGYTSTRRPLKLVHIEEFESRYEALTMERKLKGWSRAKKRAYMAGDWATVRGLAKGRHRHERKR